MFGYENISAKPLEDEAGEKIDQKLFNFIYGLKVKLSNLGLTEVQTYPYFSTKVLPGLGWDKDGNFKYLVKLLNPISKETEYLRNNIWPNLLEVADKNLRQNIKDIAIFEVGKVFDLNGDVIKESWRLAILISDKSGTEILQIIQILKDLGLDIEIKATEPPGIAKTLFHPKKFISLFQGEENVGGGAEVHPGITDKFGVNQRVAVLEVKLDSLG